MSFFEGLGPKSAPNRRKRYAVSPHSNVNNFTRNIVGANTHRYLKGKSLIKPVSKDEPQRAAIHRQAKELLETVSTKDRWVGKYARFAAARGLPRPKSEKVARVAAYTDLYQRSRRGASRMNFAGIADSEPSVDVFAHGAPGYMALNSDAGEIVPLKGVARFLSGLGLPLHSRLKIDACFSAAGTKYDGSTEELWQHWQAGTTQERLDVQQSFAANLHRVIMRDIGFLGSTDGYLGNTSIEAQEVLSLAGGPARHMAVCMAPNDTAENRYICLRKRDLRVRFVG